MILGQQVTTDAAMTTTVKQTRLHGITLVVGMGATGLSCARFLHARGVPVAVTDSRAQPPALAELAALLPQEYLLTGGFDREAFTSCARLVVSPGVALDTAEIAAARAAGVEVIGDVELFARHADAPVIAITGSNGKSTVTELVYKMARADARDVRMGGNIGVPVLELLHDVAPQLYVLELSSFQLETTYSLQPQAAVVLNFSPDHLDRHGAEGRYLAAKLRIYQGGGVAVINRDEPRLRPPAPAAHPATLTFGLDAPAGDSDFGVATVAGHEMLMQGRDALLPVSELRIRGRHNIANALAALALGTAAGLSRTAMLAALRQFRGLPHRMEWIAECHGVHWYNDSKGTNVGAAAAAISGLDAPVVLIAGGQGKGADFSVLAAALDGRGRAAILIGEDAPRLAAALQGVVPIDHAADMAAAVRLAAARARPGDAVLLSPACASFDMFAGYAARGAAFVREVRKLPC